jgi:tRNA (cytidine/uridine-2'-O-)-methyltransferase
MRVVLYQPEIYQNTCGIIRVCACLGVGLDLIYPLGFPFNISSPDSEMKRIVMDYRCDIKTHDSWDKFLNHLDLFCLLLIADIALKDLSFSPMIC